MSSVRYEWYAGKLPDEVNNTTKDVLIECGETLLRKANELVPWDTHVLENTGQVSVDTTRNEVSVSYGEGAAESYALRQHEDTGMRHKHGRSAKYLEKPFRTLKEYFEKRIQESLKKILGE